MALLRILVAGDRTRSLDGLTRILVLAFCLLPFALPPPASAQSPPQKENRFLFIINTSSAMRRMTNGIQQAVLGLLKSDMQGQMRDGDTFGLWSYDAQLRTGFPMQVWSKQNQDAILQTVSAWLAQLRYQSRPRLDKVLPAARQIIAQSRAVTLIFIFDGSETMQGTGFDKDINDLHNEFGREVRAEDIPFVTVLAARDGQVFDYRVRTPSSASLPPTADLFKPAQTNAVPSAAAAVASKPPEPRHVEIVLKPTPSPQTNPPPVAATAPAPQNAPEKPEPALQPAPPPVQPATPAGPSNPPSATLSAAPLAKEQAPATAELRNPQSPPPPPRAGEPPQQSPNPNLNPNLNPNPIAAPQPPPPPVNIAGRVGSSPAPPPPTPPPPPKKRGQ